MMAKMGAKPCDECCTRLMSVMDGMNIENTGQDEWIKELY
jgi:hypothetical protein